LKPALIDLLADPADCLVQTRLLDLDDSKLRIQALRITQLATTAEQKAVRVHDYVKAMPFGCVGSTGHFTAGQVLRNGRGDCHTKGTLFVALLRSAGVPARLRFVSLPGGFLRGILDLGSTPVTHAIGEVYAGGRWIQTDTYVVDEQLQTRALVRLNHEGQTLGYGIHANGKSHFNAMEDAHGQYAAHDPSGLPMVDFGAAHDPELFYAAHPRLLNDANWLTRAKWSIAASVVNRRTRQLRRNKLFNAEPVNTEPADNKPAG
jgi:Transglutaminase-like superfamily